MTKKATAEPKPLSIRVHPQTVKRMDDLAATMSHDPELAPTGHMSRSEVIRRALLVGLDALEAQHPTKGRKRR